MPTEDELLPPPPKKGSSNETEDILPPPPKKKKSVGDTTGTPSKISSSQVPNFGFETPLEAANATPKTEFKLPTEEPLTEKSDATTVTPVVKPSKVHHQKDLAKTTAEFNEKYGTDHTVTEMVTGTQAWRHPKDHPETVKQVEEADYVANQIKSFASGLDNMYSMILRTPSMIYNTFAIPQNIIAEQTGAKIGASDDGSGVLGHAADMYDAHAKEMKRDIEAKYDKEISDYFNEGEYKKGFEKLGLSITESLPVTLAIMGSGMAGAGRGAITGGGTFAFGSQKKKELDQIEGLSESQKMSNALATGFAEGLFEEWGTAKIGSVVADIFKTKGKDEAEKFAREAFRSTYDKAFRRLFPITAPLREGLSEAETQFAQNAIDKYTGVKPDIDLSSGVADAFLVGMGSGFVVSSPASAQMILNNKRRESVKKLDNEVTQIKNDADNPNVSPEAKEVLVQKYQDITEKINDELAAEDKDAAKYTPEEKDKVVELSEKSDKLEKAIADPMLTENSRKLMEEEKDKVDKDLDKINKEVEKKEMYQGHEFMEQTGLQPGYYTKEQVNEAKKGKQSATTKPVSGEGEKNKEADIHNETTTPDAKDKGAEVSETGVVQEGKLETKDDVSLHPEGENKLKETDNIETEEIKSLKEDLSKAKTLSKKKEIQSKIDSQIESILPEHESRGSVSIDVTDNRSADVSNIEMPDGEEGYHISIKNEDGSEIDSQDFYEKGEVVKYINNKQKGYELSKTEKPKTEGKKSNTDIKVGMEVPYRDNSGSLEKGIVEDISGSEVKIKGSGGVIHRRSIEDIQRENVLSELEQSKSDIEKTLTPPKFNPDEDATEIVKANILPIKEIAKTAFKGLNTIQDKVFGKAVDNAETWVADKVKQWNVSQNESLRVLGTGLTSYANGLPRNAEETRNKKYLTGGIKMAQEQMSRNIGALRKLIDNDLVSMERVHEVLDPEFYAGQKGKKVTDYADLNDSEKQLANVLRSMLDYVHNYNFAMGMIDVDTYNKFKGKYTPRLYESFEVPDVVKDEIDKHKNYVPNKLFTDMFKQRKEVTEEMRNTILKDPIYATAKRMMQTEVNASVLSYLENVKQDPLLVSDEAKEGFTKLTGKGYGPLKDKYVANYIVEDLKGYFFTSPMMEAAYDVVKFYDRTQLRQFVKKSHTVWNLGVQIGNLSSNFVFAFIGGLDLLTYAGNLRKASKEIKNKGEIYDLLVKSGIIGSDVLSADLIPVTPQTLLASQKEESAIKKFIGKFDNFTSKLYEGTDNNAKVAAYMSFREYGYSEEEAIKKVYESFQNYATVGKLWDFASKTPVVGNAYVKFQADLQRILKNAALKRPLTTATFALFIYTMAQIASSLSGEDDEHKELREGREFIPKMSFGFADIPLVFKTPAGEVNLSRYLSPYYIYDIGNLEHPIESWSKLLPYKFKYSEGPAKGVESWLPLPSTDDPLWGVWIAALFTEKDFRGKSIQDPLATKTKASGLTREERALNSINYIMRSQIPYYNTAHDMYLANTEGTDFYGRQKNGWQVLLGTVLKTEDFGPVQYNEIIEKKIMSFGYKMSALEQEQKDIDTLIKRNIEKKGKILKTGSISKEMFQNYVLSQIEDRVERKTKLMEKQAETQKEFNEYLEKVKDLLPNKK